MCTVDDRPGLHRRLLHRFQLGAVPRDVVAVGEELLLSTARRVRVPRLALPIVSGADDAVREQRRGRGRRDRHREVVIVGRGRVLRMVVREH